MERTVVVSECLRGSRAFVCRVKATSQQICRWEEKDARQGANKNVPMIVESHDWNVMTIFENPRFNTFTKWKSQVHLLATATYFILTSPAPLTSSSLLNQSNSDTNRSCHVLQHRHVRNGTGILIQPFRHGFDKQSNIETGSGIKV